MSDYLDAHSAIVSSTKHCPVKSHGSLDADIIIKNAPDPVFVSDLEGKILSANDAVYELLGFRPDEVLEQSLSRFIGPEETREFLAALREVIERGVTRNARLNPRSASGEVIPTTLNASALRDTDGRVIGAIGILRDMRAYERVLQDLQESKAELQEKILDLEKFEEVVVGRELKMIALEKQIEFNIIRSGSVSKAIINECRKLTMTLFATH
ncbi:PAS domain-containing protein [Dictyobacter kobayashii]|uniref:PAS domain-containing protein n=1 Tax=Dictyobacter kobayashii TaxID=2014872 RepID=A0A402AB26_9CHLR|nr:PAS domain-containing protein [Dictyobacter kobayashii]GCE16308.1 hypothetical protein KDK_01080 [Dictyobacter kobayashii]